MKSILLTSLMLILGTVLIIGMGCTDSDNGVISALGSGSRMENPSSVSESGMSEPTVSDWERYIVGMNFIEDGSTVNNILVTLDNDNGFNTFGATSMEMFYAMITDETTEQTAYRGGSIIVPAGCFPITNLSWTVNSTDTDDKVLLTAYWNGETASSSGSVSVASTAVTIDLEASGTFLTNDLQGARIALRFEYYSTASTIGVQDYVTLQE
jgi:hypothetical protein